MMHLSLALKATALGILVAIPSMMFYNGLGRKVEVNLLKWKVLNAQKIRNNREKNLMRSILFLSSTLCWCY